MLVVDLIVIVVVVVVLVVQGSIKEFLEKYLKIRSIHVNLGQSHQCLHHDDSHLLQFFLER
jgi:ABC-type lipoprotein release transport system permease subunit